MSVSVAAAAAVAVAVAVAAAAAAVTGQVRGSGPGSGSGSGSLLAARSLLRSGSPTGGESVASRQQTAHNTEQTAHSTHARWEALRRDPEPADRASGP